MKSIRTLIFPGFAISVTLLFLWYSHLQAPVVTSNMAQVELEAKNGGYRLIDAETLSTLYQLDRMKILLVDTRQTWEHRTGHIEGSTNFPMENTWWARQRNKRDLETFLGPDKKKLIVFY